MAQAAVTVHNLPKNSNDRRKARAHARRLVASIERMGAKIYMNLEGDGCHVVWGDEITIPLSVWWRFKRCYKPLLYAYLARTDRTQEAVRRRWLQQQDQKLAA
jgi:hypothetical protein